MALTLDRSTRGGARRSKPAVSRPSTPGPSRRSRRRWPLRLAIAVVVVIVLMVGGVLILLAATPSARSAPDRVAAILAAHGAPSDDGVVAPRIADALLATEDSRYYSESAIDPQGAARAMWGLVTNNPNEGGATIEVQLAKMLYTPGRSDVVALTEQTALAFKLEQDYSKTRILAMYLDAAYFGDGAYGVTQAAEHYFGLQPDQLSWGQAALLAGLVQAPSRFDPHGHLRNALSRRNQVLGRLVAVGALTRAQARAVAAQPLDPAVSFYG